MIKNKRTIFKNRVDAANKLVSVLPIENMKLEDWIVITISPGGIPMGEILAKELNSSFDFMFSEKIFANHNNECEIAIVTESEEVVIHEEVVKSFEIPLDYIYSYAKELYNLRIVPNIHSLRNNRELTDMKNKNVLLIDEGLNTGLTMMACIKTAINLGAKSVSVAVPILPDATIPDIEAIADDLYYYKNLPHFVSIDFYYKELNKITIDKVKKLFE